MSHYLSLAADLLNAAIYFSALVLIKISLALVGAAALVSYFGGQLLQSFAL
jgi:hypothetical protein